MRESVTMHVYPLFGNQEGGYVLPIQMRLVSSVLVLVGTYVGVGTSVTNALV